MFVAESLLTLVELPFRCNSYILEEMLLDLSQWKSFHLNTDLFKPVYESDWLIICIPLNQAESTWNTKNRWKLMKSWGGGTECAKMWLEIKMYIFSTPCDLWITDSLSSANSALPAALLSSLGSANKPGCLLPYRVVASSFHTHLVGAL